MEQRISLRTSRVKLTIILPVYNAELFIAKAIKSLKDQFYQDYVCIIVNDCSTDNSADIINRNIDRHFIFLNNSTNIGKVNTVNHYAALVKSKYLSIHDADDYSHPKRFSTQIKFLEENVGYKMCGTNFFEVSTNGELINKIKLEDNYDRIRKNIYSRSQFHGPTLVFHTDIIQNIGGIFRYMTMGEDIDFSMRVVENYRATNIQEFLYNYRLNANSLTKNYKHDLKKKIKDRYLISQLANQRKSNEKKVDCLMLNDKEQFLYLKEEANAYYENNKFNFLSEYISYLFHYKLFKTALFTIFYRAKKDGLSIKHIKLVVIVFKEIIRGITFWKK